MDTEVSTVRVNLSERSYDIRIGSGVYGEAVDFLRDRGGIAHVVVITDTNVDELYGDAMADRFVDAGIESHVMVVDAGETSKSPEVATDLWQTMLDEGCDRQTTVLAVGGGVVGDLAGFVAASYARGLRFFQAPTTLLAQVDSSVGGKVGVNLTGAKNMVGAFWQPHGVLIDTDVLTTLPDREYRAGLAEVVKYGVILDADFFSFLESEVDAINAREPASVVVASRRISSKLMNAKRPACVRSSTTGTLSVTRWKPRPAIPSCSTARRWQSGWCAPHGLPNRWAGLTPIAHAGRSSCSKN